MAGFITIDISQLVNRIQKLQGELDSRFLLRAIGGRLTSFVDESFRTDGRGQWRPLASLTTRITGRTKPRSTPEDRQSYQVKSDESSYVEIGTSRQTSIWQEEGTPAHLIFAVNAPILIARAKDGEWIPFGVAVYHPGNPKRPALPTEAQAEKLATDVVQGALNRGAS